MTQLNRNILEMIGSAESIGIAGHLRPDGDCIGSCLSMYLYLRKCCKEKKVDVYLEYVPEKFLFIAGSGEVKKEWDGTEYDLFMVLDSGDTERIGAGREGFLKAKNTLSIDHHISNNYFAGDNHVEPAASSTCEVLYRLFDPVQIDLEIAQALYVGIIHDTGVFKHSNTSGETLRIAAELVDKGVPFSRIIDESFYQKSYLQNQLMGRCMLESILLMHGACIFSVVTKRAMDFYGAGSKDLAGVVNQLIETEGVEIAIFLHETTNREYKVSLRSREKVDVSEIALFFGGGGHIRAAGCTMEGSVHDVINNLTAHVEEQLNSYQVAETQK